jgi:hypothetical protein
VCSGEIATEAKVPKLFAPRLACKEAVTLAFIAPGKETIVRWKTALNGCISLLLAACAASHTPVPLVGAANDISALTGEWLGDYQGNESGRSGTITFTLRAAGDSAFGEVVMVPSGFGHALVPWNGPGVAGTVSRTQTVLTIRFVRVEAGHVSGTLDPYADPRTGERLLTTFDGQLSKDRSTIAGTYTTRLESGNKQTGRWSVQRRR